MSTPLWLVSIKDKPSRPLQKRVFLHKLLVVAEDAETARRLALEEWDYGTGEAPASVTVEREDTAVMRLPALWVKP